MLGYLTHSWPPPLFSKRIYCYDPVGSQLTLPLQAETKKRRYDTQITDLAQSHSFQRHRGSSTILHSQGVDCPNRTPSALKGFHPEARSAAFPLPAPWSCWLKIHHLIALLHKQHSTSQIAYLTRAGEAPLPNCASLCWTWEQLHQGITQPKLQPRLHCPSSTPLCYQGVCALIGSHTC